MGKSPCCDEKGLKKGPWTPEEDKKLLVYIQQHGHGSWRALPAKAGLERCGKSCRLRWINYLRPDIKRGKFSLQEEQSIIQLHALLGNRWSVIANHLPKRTDNEIKNYWNTRLKKRLIKMGVDPITHKPKAHAFGCGAPVGHSANLNHMAQWESARLEAEARLVRESKLNPPRPPPQLQQQLGYSLAHDDGHQLITKKSAMMALQANRPPCLDILKAWQRVVSKTFTDAVTTDCNTVNNNIQLESPTSTLAFLENALVSPTVGLHDNFLTTGNYSMPSCGGSTVIKNGSPIDENDLRCYEKSNQKQEYWKMDDNLMALLNETMSYVNTDATWFEEDSFRPENEILMEGLSEIFGS